MAFELTHADAASPTPPRVLKPSRRDPAISQPKTVILFGRDDRGRPHGARFAGCDEAEVERAADLMDLYSLVADTAALSELAAKLPAGRLFAASGKALVPFVKTDLYERLVAAAGTPDTPVPLKAAGKAAEAPPSAGAGSGGIGGSEGGDGAAAKRPAAFDQIGIGSVVLACQGPMEGWWEAVVTHTKSPAHFVCVWRDFPDDGEFTRARKDLGLLPPDSREGLG